MGCTSSKVNSAVSTSTSKAHDPQADEKLRKLSRNISTELEKDREKGDEALKLLLLGAGDSGKSTLLKQLIHLHGPGFDEKARLPYKSVVYSNTILSIKTLIRMAAKYPEWECLWSSKVDDSVTRIKEITDFTSIDETLGRHIKIVWADPGIKRCYNMRSKFQLSDECRWYFDRIEELSKDDYIPTYQDVIRTRARSTGIIETHLKILGSEFHFLDVGGQRTERKKWVHCFEGVTAVVFVVAMSEYDQVLDEDPRTNRMHESLNLFGEICNSRWFRNTSMLLFLNKRDLFREKIQHVDMNVTFPEYTGGLNYEAGAEFLKKEFLIRNEYPRKKIYVQITCATDTENVKFTFNAVRDILIKNALRNGGQIA